MSDRLLLRTVEAKGEYVNTLAFSPDGTVLVSGMGNGTIQFWRASDGTLLKELDGDGGLADSNEAFGVMCLAFSSDGTILAAGLGDDSVRLWHIPDGKLLSTFGGYVNFSRGVTSLVFSPDGTILAEGALDRSSKSEDETLELWQVPEGKPLCTLSGSVEEVNSVVFSPDGTLLASGATDHSVRLWGVMQ
jgi:WD40 repeat protein